MTEQVAEAGYHPARHSPSVIISALVGAAATYVLFVSFLQTEAVSLLRLALAAVVSVVISLAHYWGTRWLTNKAIETEAKAVTACSLALTAIFLPLLYSSPPYPLSPLLRPWADVSVQFEVPVGSQPLVLPQRNVRLALGGDVLDARAFNLVGKWERSVSGLQLAPGDTGSLQWTGTVPDTVTLTVQPVQVATALTIYWNNVRTTAQLQQGDKSPIVIVEKSPVPWGYNLTLFVSIFILVAWALALLGLLLRERLAMLESLYARKALPWAVLFLSVLLAVLTVKLQVDSLGGGLQFVSTSQLVRHNNVLTGDAPDPWQYRLLSEWIAEGFLRVSSVLAVPHPVDVGFISLRLLQNLAIFLLAFALYKRVSGKNLLAVLGILVLAASMKNAYYDNDLAFNTYFDVIFYLLCGLLLLSRRYYAIVLLTLVAALNRETGGIIPFLMAAAILDVDRRTGLKRFVPVLLAAGLFAGVFLAMRWLYPDRPLYVPYKHPPGIDLLLYNVTRAFTWSQLWQTLGLIPILALAFLPSWPKLWRWFLVILCPVWFAVHSFASVMAETRLFLVPQALIFIPGVLFMLHSVTSPREIVSSRPQTQPGAP